MTIKARLVRSSHADAETGDIVELTETQFDAFSDKFERVEDDGVFRENIADPGPVSGNETSEGETSSSEDYPIHSGGGWYELSNGKKVRGKENAEAKEAEL